MDGALKLAAVVALGLAVAYAAKLWISWIGDLDTAFWIWIAAMVTIAAVYDFRRRT